MCTGLSGKKCQPFFNIDNIIVQHQTVVDLERLSVHLRATHSAWACVCTPCLVPNALSSNYMTEPYINVIPPPMSQFICSVQKVTTFRNLSMIHNTSCNPILSLPRVKLIIIIQDIFIAEMNNH